MREKSEYDQKLLDVRRTARVVAGGRRFSFRTLVVVGNRSGKVGVGLGKGTDVASAIEKGTFQAKKNVIIVPLHEGGTIPHEVMGKFAAARVKIKPSREGRGLIVGGPMRVILELAGIRNATAKILSRTPNKLNNARATIEALKKLKTQNSKFKTAVHSEKADNEF